jgi:hypothetical protein
MSMMVSIDLMQTVTNGIDREVEEALAQYLAIFEAIQAT